MRHPAHPDYHRTLFNTVVHDPITSMVLIGTAASPMLTVGGAMAGLSAIGGLASVAGTIAQGNAARANATSQAGQLAQQAGQARASSQVQAGNELRKGAFAESRAQAVLAASGTDPNSVTAIDDITNITGQSQYGALTALFNGEEKARGLDYASNSKMLEGKAAHDTGVMTGIGTGVKTLGTLAGQRTIGSGNSDTMLGQFADSQDSLIDNPYYNY